MYIGDIYLPILSNIDKKSVSKITKEIAGINAKEPRTVSIRKNLQPITLEGYLYNDGEKDDAQYAEDVEALQYRSAGYCYTKYADLDGFIEIENAEAPQTSEELGVRNYSVEGKYLPASKYERVVEVETEMRENEFNIEFPPHVALPVGATNVRVKTSQDSVKLSAPAFMAGDIPIYRPFPAFYPDDVTHSTGDTPKYDTTAYKMSYNLLDAKDEYISYTFVSGVDVPLGSYRVVLRIKADSTVNGDVKITVSDGTNNVVDSLHTLVGDGVWNIVKTASFSILQRGLTYTVTVSKATDSVSNIAVNYGFLLPEKRARVAFDIAAEYDVGECKVFDTITTDSEESTWIQVFNPEHDFAGDIVVQNSMFRWVIKQTAWKDATKVYNISGSAPVEIGELYNKAFGDDSVAIKFKEIKPNYLKFTFELDTGNATSESTSAKEIDTVEITPFNVVIDKDVIGAYKDHYTFESTPITMVEYENGIIAGIDSNSVYGLIKSVNVTSSYDGDIIETTGSESSDSYVVPFVIPCEITSYLYKQAADLVISKDNGDVERKFFKDDFSVDSSDNWNVDVGTVTVDTVNKKLVYSGVTPGDNWYPLAPANAPVSPRKVSFICNIDPENVNNTIYRYIRFHIGSLLIGEFRRQNNSTEYSFRLSDGLIDRIEGFGSGDTGTYEPDTHVEFEIGSDNIVYGYLNGVLRIKGKIKSGVDISGAFNFKVRVSGGSSVNFEFKEVTVSPSESYADNFTTDTTERYQPVLGTVAYDDTNKRMNVTTATGANGKASGRLKSYKFTEGSQIYDVTLPTGADGDFITLVTHSANGLMTDGIGVGLQSDGAGNWNLATLSGTTVTVGASSGLTDGKTARIEIEKDITGAYWYYIYDAAGTKPTTATGKLFTTLTEGYTGWYANGNSKTYAIDNITIRAESIVGRTNVEVTEPFWFRDEFREDSRGRFQVWGNIYTPYMEYDSTGQFMTVYRSADSIQGGARSVTKLSTFDVTLTMNTTWYQGALYLGGLRDTRISDFKRFPVNSLGILFDRDSVTLQKATTDLTDIHTVNTGTDFRGNTVRVTLTGREFAFYINDLTTPTFTYTLDYDVDPGYVWLSEYTLAWPPRGLEIHDLQISGTRVYNKPIHRGAMLETYHDGTQEVVGTTFIDDFNWDRSEEYTVSTTATAPYPVFDTVNGCLRMSNLPEQSKIGITKVVSNGLSLATGFIYARVKCVSENMHGFSISAARTELFIYSSNSKLYAYNADVIGESGGSFPAIPHTTGDIIEYFISYDLGSNSIGVTIYKNGEFIWSAKRTITHTLSKSPVGFRLHAYGGADIIVEVQEFVAIGLDPTATNGIAACIPPIGGGARYGVEESVYNTFTTENVNKGVYLTTARVKTTNPNADEVSLEYVNETTSTTLNTTPIDVDATYTVKTAPITIDANETDTLRVSVKNSTTYDQSAIYVDSLSMIPVSGDDVLYPQDLTFISGVKPSQKRKVEVK